MKPERKLWHELKKSTPKISWTRIENTGAFGTPDLLGYNTRGHFFTLELKVTKANKITLLTTSNCVPREASTQYFYPS